MGHYQHRLKHIGCGLHFVVASWKEDWPDRTIYCPECGGTSGYIHWIAESPDEIYRFVPGNAIATEILMEVMEAE